MWHYRRHRHDQWVCLNTCNIIIHVHTAKRKFSDSKKNNSTWSAKTSAKANPIQIWNRIIWFQSLTCGFLVERCTYDKIFRKISSIFLRDMSQTVEKFPISQCWRILQKVLNLDPDADDSRNLIISSMSTDTFLVKVFFVKMRSVGFVSSCC